MPEWLIGLLSGASLLWVGKYVDSLIKRHQFRYEKLLDHYSEFVGFASDELARSKSLRAGLALFPNSADCTHLTKLDEERHELRRQLERLSLKIRLFEEDKSLSKKVATLVNTIPFEPFLIPPRPGEGNYNERSDRFNEQIKQFESDLKQIIDDILKKHSRLSLNQLHED